MTEQQRNGIGVIADDLTGAQDIGLMIAMRGFATRVLMTPWIGMTAVPGLVLEVHSRGDDSFTAYQKTRDASKRAIELGRWPLYKKMSSTFQGNIGAEIDAVLDEAGVEFTVVVPAFPANGRLVKDGILYVNGVPVSETWLAHHPTSPITDSFLPRVLAAQTRRRVGLIDWRTVTQGPEALHAAIEAERELGGMVILDVTSDQDLVTIAEAVRDLDVLSGGSALASTLDLGAPSGDLELPVVPNGGPEATLIISGSVSEASRRQVEAAAQAGVTLLTLDVITLLQTEMGEIERVIIPLAEEAAELLRAGRNVLVRTPSEPDEVRDILTQSVAARISEQAAGQRVGEALSRLAEYLTGTLGLTRLVVAGGDTSSAVCRKLGLLEHAIVGEVETGVALSIGVAPESGRTMALVLKSGNFGSVDFFTNAITAVMSV